MILAWVAIGFGVIALPGLLPFIPGIRETWLLAASIHAANLAPFPATVSWLLAVIATVIALVQLIRRRNTRNARKALALAGPGAILGSAAVVFVYIYIGNLLGAFDPNAAEEPGVASVEHYLDQGASQICEESDNGHGENRYPWYTAYLDVPAEAGTEATAQEALAVAGFSDARVTEISEYYELPATTEAFMVESLEVQEAEYEGAPITPLARIEVFPDGPVSLGCFPPDGEWGDDIEPDEGRVIVVVHIVLDSTR